MTTCRNLPLTLFVAFVLPAAAPAAVDDSWQAAMQTALRQEAVRMDNEFLSEVKDREQWEEKRPELHRQFLEMLGLWPLPERTPLHAEVTGVLSRPEGFRVEKVHFQSRPRLYVTGNLYLPADAQAGAKLPAILYVCGHSGRGRDGNKAAFQHHGMWFATHGYACLTIDTLQLGEIAGIHHGTYRHDRWWWHARGYTPAGVECWNGIRALDYLQSRPEIDPERMGVTGISGGGAATFWIAAADERVKVAVPVSGMGDLEDYLGEKVVNGHCDCMFLHNVFQWPWTQIAALVVPRPMLFENSGHDTIFPMNGNDRIRGHLEKLYGYYTNRTDRLFDIGVTPGGHDDKPELRLMAYRWLNRFLKNDDRPVTEPELPLFEGPQLRAFPKELPADEINSRVDEFFVTAATNPLPVKANFTSWRADKLKELRRVALRAVHPQTNGPSAIDLKQATSTVTTVAPAPGTEISYRYFPGSHEERNDDRWMVLLSDNENISGIPLWASRVTRGAPVLLIQVAGLAEATTRDVPPFYVQRSLALLGRTADTSKLEGVLTIATPLLQTDTKARWNIVGRGRSGVIAAYAALLEPRLSGITVVDPPVSHRDGPFFLHVMRVLDIPEALGLLAPRPLTIIGPGAEAFRTTASLYELGAGPLQFQAAP